MSVYVGEAVVLYGVALFNIVVFLNDGWICGRLTSQFCLGSYVMAVVMGCLSVALPLSLIAAILHNVAVCSDPDSTSSRRLHVNFKVMVCLVAIVDVFAIFYYYSHLTMRLWSHILGGVFARMALAIAITKLTYGYSED